MSASPTGLPSLRDEGENGVRTFYRASAPDGAIRDRFFPLYPIRHVNMSRRDKSPAETAFTDGVPNAPLGAKHVPQGHKLGRDGVHGRVPNAPSGAEPHLLPQLSLSKFLKLMASDKWPISMFGLPSRSAMVRATFRMRS